MASKLLIASLSTETLIYVEIEYFLENYPILTFEAKGQKSSAPVEPVIGDQQYIAAGIIFLQMFLN